MKKLALFVIAIGIGFSASAQSEPFVKALKKLEYGSTILDAAMLFKKDFPAFKALTNAPVLVQSIQNPEDTTEYFTVEAFFFVNEKAQELVQLYFVDDRLYEKSVFWFFPADSVAAVELKYKKVQNTFIANPKLLSLEGGSVKHTEEKYDRGAVTHFPIKKVGHDEHAGKAGYELVYTREGGARGFWVYANLFTTMDVPVNNQMGVPHVAVPQGNFGEIKGLLLNPDNYKLRMAK